MSETPEPSREPAPDGGPGGPAPAPASPPPRRRRRPLGARRKAAFALLTTALLFGVAEGFFRVREWTRARRRQTLSPRQPDAWRGKALIPGARFEVGDHVAEINALGMREGPVGPKAPGVVRVLCVGASTTYGLYVTRNAHTWPARTGERLRALGASPPIEVLNGGCPAWDLRTSLTNLELRLFDLEPDVVVACHVYNDVVANLDPGYVRDSRATSPWGVFRPWHLSALYRFALSRAADASDLMKNKVSGLSPEGLAAYERNLRALVAACRARGVTLVLTTEPDCYRPTFEESVAAGVPGMEQWFGELCPLDYPTLMDGLERYRDVVRRVAQEEGLALIDLARDLPRDVSLFASPVHRNDAGEVRVAELVAPALARVAGEVAARR